jgi:hypothetical protein
MISHNKNLVFMVRPVMFYSNPETAETNAFQSPDQNSIATSNQAIYEFDNLVSVLQQAGIRVHIEQDYIERDSPDSIFPNNWVSFHDGIVNLYPMCSPNRRRERSQLFIENIFRQNNDVIKYYRDFTFEERSGRFLEGTGSVVFDHVNAKAYACLSERTQQDVLCNLCEALGYEPVTFNASDQKGKPIYHTNVMMSIGEHFAVICGESIDASQRINVINQLISDGKEIIDISYGQMNQFCGNILQLSANDGSRVIAMSLSAYNAFTNQNKFLLEQHGYIVYSDISTIERNGGGSVRCMICEVE